MEKKPLAQKFGAVIRRLREERDWSQEKFAEFCDLHRTYIGTLERGEKVPTIITANRLATELGLKLSEVFLLLEADSEVDTAISTDTSTA